MVPHGHPLYEEHKNMLNDPNYNRKPTEAFAKWTGVLFVHYGKRSQHERIKNNIWLDFIYAEI